MFQVSRGVANAWSWCGSADTDREVGCRKGWEGGAGDLSGVPSREGEDSFQGGDGSVSSHIGVACWPVCMNVTAAAGCWLACRQWTQASAGRWGQDTGVSAVVSAGVRTSGSTGSRSSFSISIWSRSSAGLSVVSSLSP